jgi:arylsulfatase A-like enzyme
MTRLAFALLTSLTFCVTLSAQTSQPNVLFIAVDDLRDWVGYLGQNKQTLTPHLDRLAARGTSFTRSYCAAPVCNASRAALMTGLRPSTSGVYENNVDWRPLVSPDKTLISTFRQSGYLTLGAGKIYHGGFDRKEEWDDYGQPKQNEPKPQGNDGVGGIKFAPLDCEDKDTEDYGIVQYGIDHLGKTHEKPFLLTIGLHKPHMPWNVPRAYFDKHPLDKIELPPYLKDDLSDVPKSGVKMAKPEGDHAKMIESGRWKEAVQAYLATITFSDAMIGRLIDALDKSAYKDNTIIVLWSDHGWHLGEKDHWRKFALWENATRSPLLWAVPGVTKPGSVCERTVDFMSIYPTLCDLCGIKLPSHVEGSSIKSLLADPQAAWDRPALITYEFNNHAVRSERWRYIRYNNGDQELYDHQSDPNEWKNVASDPGNVPVIAELAKSLPQENKVRPEPSKPGGKAAKKKKQSL